MDVVSSLRTALAGKIGKERFELWFGPRTRLRYNGRALRVAAPNGFFLDWIRSNFRTELEAACKSVLGQGVEVEFAVETMGQVDGREPAPSEQQPDARPRPTDDRSTTTDEKKMVALSNPTPRERKGAPLTVVAPHAADPGPSLTATASAFGPRKFASLSSFVVGPCNKLAAFSAEMVAREPGKITPFFVHGPTSVGKTHLLEGIWSVERKAGRGPTSIYLSAEQFTSQFMEALRGGGMPIFRRKYRGVRVLIIDDIQFLIGKRSTQVEMMNTIDTLLREGRQVVVAADRPPAEFKEFMPELVTRLGGGMVCSIEPPDYSTRLGIVSHLARRLGVALPSDVERFVASQFTGHARELSGAICRLRATSEAHREKITLALAEEALGEMIRQNSRVVRLGDIEKAVCNVFGIEPQTLQADGKSRRVSQPRMLAMWLARKHTRAALSEIGEFFGRRSHSTVISAQKRVDQWVTLDEPIAMHEQTWKIDEAIRQIEQRLGG